MRLCNFGFLTEFSQRMFLHRREAPEQILCVQGLKARFSELAAALGGVDLLPRQLVKPLNRQDDRLAVPVGRQQVARVVRFFLTGDVDGVSPAARAGGQEQV